MDFGGKTTLPLTVICAAALQAWSFDLDCQPSARWKKGMKWIFWCSTLSSSFSSFSSSFSYLFNSPPSSPLRKAIYPTPAKLSLARRIKWNTPWWLLRSRVKIRWSQHQHIHATSVVDWNLRHVGCCWVEMEFKWLHQHSLCLFPTQRHTLTLPCIGHHGNHGGIRSCTIFCCLCYSLVEILLLRELYNTCLDEGGREKHIAL